MSNVRAEIGFSGEDPDTEVASLVAGVVSKGGVTHWPGRHTVLLLFDVDSLNDWIHLLDVLRDVLILGDVVGGGDGVVRGEGHQLRR